jgi:hypothetical protein
MSLFSLQYIAGVTISLAFDDSLDFAKYVVSESIFNAEEFWATFDDFHKQNFNYLFDFFTNNNISSSYISVIENQPLNIANSLDDENKTANLITYVEVEGADVHDGNSTVPAIEAAAEEGVKP